MWGRTVFTRDIIAASPCFFGFGLRRRRGTNRIEIGQKNSLSSPASSLACKKSLSSLLLFRKKGRLIAQIISPIKPLNCLFLFPPSPPSIKTPAPAAGQGYFRYQCGYSEGCRKEGICISAASLCFDPPQGLARSGSLSSFLFFLGSFCLLGSLSRPKKFMRARASFLGAAEA